MIKVLLEVFNSCSTVQKLSSFFVNIKDSLMIAPVIYVITGSCGVALLRRSGDYPNVLRAVVEAERNSYRRVNAGGSIPPPRTFHNIPVRQKVRLTRGNQI